MNKTIALKLLMATALTAALLIGGCSDDSDNDSSSNRLPDSGDTSVGNDSGDTSVETDVDAGDGEGDAESDAPDAAPKSEVGESCPQECIQPPMGGGSTRQCDGCASDRCYTTSDGTNEGYCVPTCTTDADCEDIGPSWSCHGQYCLDNDRR